MEYTKRKNSIASLLPSSVFERSGQNAMLTQRYNQQASAVPQPTEDERPKDTNGPLGGIGYVFEKIGLGFLQSVEGLWDYTAGGLATMFGGADGARWAEEQMSSDLVDYNHADEWYNPSDGWKFAGDIAGGIGTSLPSIAGVAAGAAVTYFSGGTLSPLAAKIIAGSIAGFGATVAGLGAAGNATKEAYRESGKLGAEEWAYGALSGATEAGLELVTSGLGKGTGRIIKSISDSAAKKATKSIAKSTAKTVFMKLGEDFASEAVEEGLSEILSPVYKRMTYDSDAEFATLDEIGYAALVGGMSGVVMGGAGSGFNSVRNFVSGRNALNNGTAEGILNNAKQLSEREAKYDTGYEVMKAVKSDYEALKQSLETTGGKVSTYRQKALLGNLKRNTSISRIMPLIERSAELLVNGADVIAEKYNTLGMKGPDGKPINVTAEQIRDGIKLDGTRKEYVKSLRKALSDNPILSTLAIADAMGNITMDTRRFAEATLDGRYVADQADLNYLAEHGKPEELEALGKALGIEDFSKVTESDFREKLGNYLADGNVSEWAKQAQRIRAAAESTDTAKPLPHLLRGNLSDGIHKYSSRDGAVNMAVFKEGDEYRIYDYDGQNISNPLTKRDVNRILNKYWTEGVSPAKAEIDSESNAINKKTPAKKADQDNTRYAIKFLSENDLPDYLRAGGRSNKYKQEAINNGKKIILSTPKEINDYVRRAIAGEKGLPTVAYAKVDDRLAQEVVNYSNGEININNFYLELVANDIHHAYQEHSDAKEAGDISLNESDFENIPQYIATYDDFVYAIKYKSGNTKICVSKKITGGRVLLIETVSKSHGSIEFKNAIGVSEQKYLEEYEKKYKKRNSTNTRGSDSSNNSLRDATASIDSIPENAKKSNSFSEKSLKTPSDSSGDGDKDAWKKKVHEIKERLSVEAIDKYCKDNIDGYNKLSAPNQQAVRMTVRQAQAHGLSDVDVKTYGTVAARSGLNIIFDAESAFGDGAIVDNNIYVNPKLSAERTYELVLSHEMFHKMFRDGDKRVLKLFRDAKRFVSPEKAKAVEKKYKDFYNEKLSKGASVKKEDSDAMLDDAMNHYINSVADEEVAAAGVEEALNHEGVWNYILAKESTLGQRVLAFFRGSARDYSFNEGMSRQARKFVRDYKKLFDSIAERNQGANARSISLAGGTIEKDPVTSINNENMHVKGDKNNFKETVKSASVRYANVGKTKVTNTDRTFSYDELVAKDDLVGFTIKHNTQVPLNSDGSIDGKKIVNEVRKQCKTIQTKSSSPTYFINVSDIGRNVEIVEKSITHGFFDSTKKNKKPSPRDLLNAKISLVIPEILKNSIEVNRSERKGNRDIPYAHIMIGTVGIINNNGLTEYYAVRSVVEERTNLNPLLVEAEILGKLHAVNAKKVDSPNLKVAKNSVARGHGGAYTYNIAHFLNDVKGLFDDTFSNDVYQTLGDVRKNTAFSKELRFALKPDDGTPSAPDAEQPGLKDGGVPARLIFDDAEKNGYGEKFVDVDRVLAKGAPRTSGYVRKPRGSLKELVANATKFRVMTRSGAMDAINKISYTLNLSKNAKRQIADNLWQGFNDCKSVKQQKAFAHDLAEYVVAGIVTGKFKENQVNSKAAEAIEVLDFLRVGLGKVSFSKENLTRLLEVTDRSGVKHILGRWGYRKSKTATAEDVQPLKYPIDVFVSDLVSKAPKMEHLKELSLAEAMLEIDKLYEQSRKIAEKKYSYSDLSDSGTKELINDLAKELIEAYYSSSQKSMLSNIVDKKISYYKERYEKIKKRESVQGLLTYKANRMKDLKKGTFLRVNEYKSDELLGAVERLSAINYRGKVSTTIAKEAISNLAAWYSTSNEMLRYKNEMDPGLYDVYTAEMIKKLAEFDGDEYGLFEMNLLSDVMSYFINFAEKFNKIKWNDEYVDAMPKAKKYVKNIDKRAGEHGPLDKHLFVKYIKTFNRPESVAAYMDGYEREDAFHSDVFHLFQKAELEEQLAEMRLKTEFDEFNSKNKKYEKRISKELVKFRGIEMPRTILLALYMTMKRDSALPSLAVNGFSYEYKGKTYRPGGLAPKVGPWKALKATAETWITEIEDTILTEKDKEYVSIVEKVYNRDGRELKSKRDMESKGYEQITDGYYYPTATATRSKNVDTPLFSFLDRVEHAAFNKSTIQGANSEKLIEPVNVVFHRYVKGVCNYAYISPAIETFNVLYNLNTVDNRGKPVSIATQSQNVWKGSLDYYQKLISDMQGIRTSTNLATKITGIARGNVAKTALALNPKVLLTQLGSLFASFSQLRFTSLVGGIKMIQYTKDVDSYCAFAKLRHYDNTAARAQGLLDDVGKISEKLMTPIGWVDRKVVQLLFGACMLEAQKNGNGKAGTHANKEAAGELLTQILLETQQNSLVTSRSAAMRDGSELLKTLTMFSADAIQTVGVLFDSIGTLKNLRAKLKAETNPTLKAELRTQLKVAKVRCAKATASLLMTAVWTSVAALIARGLLRQLDDETAEDNLRSFAWDTVGNMLGGLPVLKDLYTCVVDGFGVESATYSSLNSLFNRIRSLFNFAEKIESGEATSQDVTSGLKGIIEDFGQLIGLPVRNAEKAGKALVTWVSHTAAYQIDNTFYKKNYKNDFYEALEKGDDQMASMVMSLLYNERTGSTLGSRVHNELYKLSSAGYKVIPKSVGNSITYDGQTVEIPEELAEEIRREYTVFETYLEQLLRRSEYKGMSAELRARVINNVYDVCYLQAQESVLGADLGGDRALSKAVGVDTIAIFNAYKKGVTSDKDEDGKTVSGSKRKKILDIINRMGVSVEQKLLLLCANGYTIKDGDIVGLTASAAKKRLLAYILKLSGTSAAEKAELAEMCGFEVKDGKIVRKTAF